MLLEFADTVTDASIPIRVANKGLKFHCMMWVLFLTRLIKPIG